MAGRMSTKPFGPWPKGLVDRANPSDPNATAGALRRMRGVVFSGANRLAVRPGDAVAMSFMDDQGSPAPVTTMCAIEPFTNVALAVGHSTNTNKAYVYVVAADFSGWFDNTGTFHANTTASPAAVLWTGMTVPPDVTIAEGLGTATIATNAAASSSILAFATQQFTPPSTVVTLASDLDGTGSNPIFFAGVVAFEQHLWGWGFGSGASPVNGYRPELLRFCQPNFTLPFLSGDSITVGDRVRSQRETVVAAKVAGNALFFGTPFSLTRITGFGRDSWFKQPLDNSCGIAGIKAVTTRLDTIYYWSNRGPMRCQAQSVPEPLWPALENTLLTLINPQRIVAGYDLNSDLVTFFYDAGQGVRTWCGFDCTREVWTGPDDDIGLVVNYAGNVAPIFTSTVNAPVGSVGPAGPPTTPSTTLIGAISAQANWVAGDLSAQTSIEYRRQGDTGFIVALLSPGVTFYQFQGLQPGVAYEWRAAHFKGGQLSSYLGPGAGTQFTTATTLIAPSNLLVFQAGQGAGYVDIGIIWTPGEPGASTVLLGVNIPPGTYVPLQTIAAPNSSTVFRVNLSATYSFKIQHTAPNATASSLVGPQSITVTVT